jgi:predicted molibdopterin-dependent oxidoreductase YjgC
MTKIQFELDGKQVEADAGETIWQVAKRQGREIPHLCYSPEPDYRPDGNCRACMVEIEGERVLAASCKRTPSVGMKVKTESARAVAAQKMVMELLVADQPARETSHDPDSKFWHWAEKVEVTESRFPAAERWEGDASHPAMRVNLDSCIQCGLCVRACREVQVNDVIGMAYRNHDAKIVFDFDDPMGESTCVACGECVQACPTGALMPSVMLDENQTRVTYPDRKVDSLCPFCGVGCQVTYQVKDEKVIYAEGRDGPTTIGSASRAASASTTSTIRTVLPSRWYGCRMRRRIPTIRSIRPIRSRISAKLPGKRRSISPQKVSSRFAMRRASRRWPASARPRAPMRRLICSRSWYAPASAPTMSTTARGCATPRPWRR